MTTVDLLLTVLVCAAVIGTFLWLAIYAAVAWQFMRLGAGAPKPNPDPVGETLIDAVKVAFAVGLTILTGLLANNTFLSGV